MTTDHDPELLKNSSILDSPTAKAIGLLADIIGVTGGIIGVITFLLAIRSPVDDTSTQVTAVGIVTPFHVFGLWLISSYIYIALIHRFWQTRKSKQPLDQSFWKSVRNDFLRDFRFPFVLLPGVLLVVLFGWVIIEVAIWREGFGVVIVFILFFAAMAIPAISEMGGPEKKSRSFKQDVDENWKAWEKRIRTELKYSETDYITVYKLKDLAEIWQINTNEITYAYARYASLNPQQTVYGTLYVKKQGVYEPVFSTKILAKRSAQWGDGYLLQ